MLDLIETDNDPRPVIAIIRVRPGPLRTEAWRTIDDHISIMLIATSVASLMITRDLIDLV